MGLGFEVPCYSPLKGWKDTETGGIVFKGLGTEETMEVACSQCLGCRLDRSRMWAMRIAHEASLHEHSGGNCFVTLTYRDRAECDDEQLRNGYFIPEDWSLHKSHFQLFMKRLRKQLANKIRFFHCGEYGNRCKHGIDLERVGCPLCQLGRPHYHACLFNVCFGDLEQYTQINGQPRYTSRMLSRIWKYGFVDVGELNFESAAYVARYCLKKVNGLNADTHYYASDMVGEVTFLEPEYCTMSRRPGIGKAWFDEYKDDLFPSDEVPVPGSGVFKGMPRYYEELFKKEDPIGLEEIKEIRKAFMEAHGGDFTPERLMAKYRVKKAQVTQLKRIM